MKYRIIEFEYEWPRVNKYTAMYKKHWWNMWKGIPCLLNDEYDVRSLHKYLSPEDALKELKNYLKRKKNEVRYPIIRTYSEGDIEL